MTKQKISILEMSGKRVCNNNLRKTIRYSVSRGKSEYRTTYCLIGVIILTFLLGSQTLKAVGFNNSSFGIGEFSDKESILLVFRDTSEITNFGLSIIIETDSTNKKLWLKLEDGELSFAGFLVALQSHLENNAKTVFPLFIHYKGAESLITEELQLAQLLDKVYYHPPGERWPTLESILAKNKQLVIFNRANVSAESNFINLASQHVVGFSIDNSLNASSDKLIYKGSIKNELLQISKFTEENISKPDVPEDWSRISLNTFCIDYLLDCWNSTGKRPNFIFYTSAKRNMTIHYLSKTIRDYGSISGKVLAEGKILNGISWQHNNQSYTNGYFNFPYDEAASLTLTPLKQGYRFKPQDIQIDDSSLEKDMLEFTATPLLITDGLTASYKLDNSVENLVNPNQKHQKANSFINDNERGAVLKLENKAYVPLRKADDYNIVNSSFTISIYFKLIPKEDKYEYCLFGSNEEGYRKGLHVIIKSMKPFFGFYTNDCSATTKISPLKWHQLAVRYDINSQEQSIFIDGEKVGESINHPSFIGSSELLLGHGIKQDNYMNGYLDDLNIWNRALSDNEIQWLNKNSIRLKTPGLIKGNLKLLLLLLTALFGMVVVFMLRKRKRNNKSKVESGEAIGSNYPTKNAIYLYGKFMVIDEEGINHAEEFSPKTRELFLLLLMHSIKNPEGISTSELTDTIWSGFDADKAANNRGVTFNNLKKTLANINGIEVVYENKYWRLVVAEDIVCDYKLVRQFIAEKKSDYAGLFNMIKHGEFLLGVTKEWLLDYQSTHNFDLIDKLLIYSRECFQSKDYEKTLEITNYILVMDNLNVQALHYQLQCLTKQGSGSKAAFLFDKFCQRYKAAYTKPFAQNLKEFLNTNVDGLW